MFTASVEDDTVDVENSRLTLHKSYDVHTSNGAVNILCVATGDKIITNDEFGNNQLSTVQSVCHNGDYVTITLS